MAVMEQLGNRVFTQAADVNHFNDHVIFGMEIDHFSALTRCVVRAYIAVRINTYKNYGQYQRHGHYNSEIFGDFRSSFHFKG